MFWLGRIDVGINNESLSMYLLRKTHLRPKTTVRHPSTGHIPGAGCKV